MRSVLVLTLALSPLVACGPAAPPPPPPPPPPAPESPQVSLADVGLDASAMNRDAKPCEDFYEYACGGWVKKTEIPADRSRWVRSFSEINERNEQDLKRIVESAASAPKTPVDHAIGDYYAGCMDEAAIEKDGLSSIQLYLDVAGSVAAPGRAKRSLDDALTELHKVGVDAFFDLASTQDFQDATKVIAEIDQGGLGLPDRDYYLEDDDKMKEIRAFYVQHVAHMLELSGVPKQAAKKQAEAILRLETKIAEISKTRVERRDPKGMYNNIGKSGLLERKKGLDWEAYLKRRGLEAITDLNVTSIPFVEGLGELLKREPKPTIASYLRWQVLHSVAPSLGKAFVDEDFALTQKLFGTEQLLPRWKRCVASTDFALGELLAQAFVAERFSPESKQAVIQMVREIGKAMGERLAGLEWMDPTTKKRAEEKLAAMDYLIGYPDKWRHYDFPIDRAHHPKNRLLATAWEVNRDLGKIGKPVDRGEWFMTPPTVNAYYSPLRNHMVFPAGILQPPFYNPKASVAVNMGAMGMVVGHELTHGFDDEGSGSLRGQDQMRRGRMRRLRGAAGRDAQRQAHPGREHRRRGRRQARLPRLSSAARRRARAPDRRGAERGSAVLRVARPGVVRQVPRGLRPRLGQDRSPLHAALPGQRQPHEHARVRRGLRLPGGLAHGAEERLHGVVIAPCSAAPPQRRLERR